MGKIRVKTIGLEEQEQDEKKKAKARAEAKRIEAAKKQGAEAKEAEALAKEPVVTTTAEAKKVSEKPKTQGKKTSVTTKKAFSESYKKAAALVDKRKHYKLAEALPLLEKLKRASFDETVELHINTHEKGISGNFILPHGTGKTTRVVIANATADTKYVEELIKSIEAGKIEFDVLIATPETMAKLAKVARVLGPRGLMPNPKNGTVTPKPDEVAKKFAGGQINFKTEAKFPLLHLTVGKVSFGDKKLAENITTAIKAVKTKNIRTVTLKSTMSPGIKLEIANL